jgi:hypothetical protein
MITEHSGGSHFADIRPGWNQVGEVKKPRRKWDDMRL